MTENKSGAPKSAAPAAATDRKPCPDAAKAWELATTLAEAVNVLGQRVTRLENER